MRYGGFGVRKFCWHDIQLLLSWDRPSFSRPRGMQQAQGRLPKCDNNDGCFATADR